MSDYTPDLWVIAKMSQDNDTVCKVFGSWYGGYMGSDSWQLSSGITKIVEHDDRYEIHNVSGSIYDCYKNSFGMSSYSLSVWNSFVKKQETGNYTIEQIDIKDVEVIV
jgi:hypothetical protein